MWKYHDFPFFIREILWEKYSGHFVYCLTYTTQRSMIFYESVSLDCKIMNDGTSKKFIHSVYKSGSTDYLVGSVVLINTLFNSLGPGDAIWRQRTGSTLAQVMACCLTAPSHYLNQCWLIISKIQLHSSDGGGTSNFTRNASVIND